ncbi:MAG: hypothetical protein ACUVTL_02665 [Thermoproteota archaeon]
MASEQKTERVLRERHVSSLDRHVNDKRIKEAMDIVNVFADIGGRWHELIPALHALL